MPRDPLNHKKEDLSRLFWMLGVAVTLPMVLLSGPLAGFLISQWLIQTWHLSTHLTLILVLAGLAGSVVQTIRLLKQLNQGNRKKNL